MRTGTMPRVAVVDSDSTNCKLMREICHVGGWDVAGWANNVDEGLDIVARTGPACLITDYDFGSLGQPGGTGLDLIARAKSLKPDLFTIMITGWDINDVAAHVRKHQPDRILRKPVPPHLLMNLLKRIYTEVDVIRVRAV